REAQRDWQKTAKARAVPIHLAQHEDLTEQLLTRGVLADVIANPDWRRHAQTVIFAELREEARPVQEVEIVRSEPGPTQGRIFARREEPYVALRLECEEV